MSYPIAVTKLFPYIPQLVCTHSRRLAISSILLSDDHLAYVNSHSNVGIVPSITEVTNAQGTIILESSTNEQQVKKRMPEVHLIEGDKAVKKKRRFVYCLFRVW